MCPGPPWYTCFGVKILGGNTLYIIILLINPRLRACAERVIVVGLSVCVCVRVCPSVHRFFLVTAATLCVKRGYIYYQVGGMHGKLRFWSGEGRGSW